MIRILSTGVLVCLLVGPAVGDDSSAQFFPPSTVVYAELDDPSELVATIFDHPLRARIESLEPYKMAVQTPDYRRFQMGRVFVEGHFGMPWRDAIATFAGNGVSFALDGESKGAAVVIHGKDEAAMKTLRDKLIELAQLGEEGGDIKSADYRGVTAYEINKAKFAIKGQRMVVTNNGDLGKAILDRLIDQSGESLADNARYQLAVGGRGEDRTAWAFVDIEVLRDSGVAPAVYKDRIDNPVLELLVGGIQSCLTETPFVTATATARTEGLSVRLSMPHQADWIPDHREYYFGPDGGGRGPTLPETTDTLLTLSTYRDVSQMWLRAGDLFGPQTNDGFAKADANLTTFFSGRDFGEDILGSMEPEVGLVATRQDFDGRLPAPTIKVPAFALVLELRDPETMTPELRRVFKNLIGFLSVVGAMNGQNQLELDSEELGGGVELVSASFVPEDDDRESTQAEIIFNFSPTVGFAGKRFVVASTESLARELVSAAPPSQQSIEENTRARLHAGVLRQVLNDNRGQLIAQNMLEDGNSREEAEAVIDLVLEVVDYFNDASLSLRTGDGQLNVDLQVHVKPY